MDFMHDSLPDIEEELANMFSTEPSNFRRREHLEDVPLRQRESDSAFLSALHRENRIAEEQGANMQRSLSLTSYMTVLSPRPNRFQMTFPAMEGEKRRNSWSTLFDSGKSKLLVMKQSFVRGVWSNEDSELLSEPLVAPDDDTQEFRSSRGSETEDSDVSTEFLSSEEDGNTSADEDSVLVEDLTCHYVQEAEPKKLESQAQDCSEDLDDEESCFICLSPFENVLPGERMVMPCSKQCNPAFVHSKCIFEWRERRNNSKENSGTCPLCREPLADFKYTPPDRLQIHNFTMFSARKQFVVHPIAQEHGMVRCYLRVTPSSWMGNSTYEMFIQAPCSLPYPLGVLPTADGPREGDQFLLCARKKGNLFNSKLDISFDRSGDDFDPRSPNYAGFVQTNFSGLEHTIASHSQEVGMMELGSVAYAQNRFGLGVGPRKMRICLPKVEEIETSQQTHGPAAPTHITKPNRPTRKSETLVSIMQRVRENPESNPDVFYGENREPCWLEAIQAYSLDFHGRVTLPSNKNFQLCMMNRPGSKEETVLQFGKVVSHETNSIAVYTLDFQWPISPLQAFGIALSSCDRKLACA